MMIFISQFVLGCASSQSDRRTELFDAYETLTPKAASSSQIVKTPQASLQTNPSNIEVLQSPKISHPENKSSSEFEMDKVLTEVLDQEVEKRRKAVIAANETRFPEELSPEEAKQQIKTWLERSESLYLMKQYDLALFAAEKVFAYDGNHRGASRMIDKIKRAALKEGKAQSLFIEKVYEEEIADRIELYRGQTREMISDGKIEQAKFTAQKILLLEPEDNEALLLYRQIMQIKGAKV